MNTTSSRARDRFTRALPLLRTVPLAAAVAVGLCRPAAAATIAVDDASATSVPGKCTLVDAIAALNTRSAVNGCSAADGNSDVIDLSGFTTPTTITLTQASGGHALMLSNPVTLRGALAADGTPLLTIERSSVSGTPQFGLLMSSAALTIDGLILQNGATQSGYCGGAVAVGDDLVVNNSIIRNNASSGGGGGLFATGDMTLNHSIVTGNSAVNGGGGLVAVYALHAYDSTVSDNKTTASDGLGGGGMYASGFVVVANSKVIGNTSASKAGGIYSLQVIDLQRTTVSGNAAQGGAGGGVFARQGGISTRGSTISDNTAASTGGGINATDADFTNSTISGNRSGGDGAGVFANNATFVYSTLAANVSTGGTGGGVNFQSSGVANGTIVYGNTPDDVNTPVRSALTGSFDLIGSAPWGVPAGTLNCDPKLGALGQYGGPTPTMQPGGGSCAIDAASASPTVSTDQRDDARPGVQGGKADIGAAEANSQQSSSNDAVFGNGFQ